MIPSICSICNCQFKFYKLPKFFFGGYVGLCNLSGDFSFPCRYFSCAGVVKEWCNPTWPFR